ncbi:MAG: extracellular solute-binding protein [Anaerolineae bacterium]|nr:extracellular solute-binding protein [Anaerolineae bacterium]
MTLKRHLGLLLVAALLVAGFPAAAQSEAITLVVWDNWVRDAEQEMIEILNAEFEAAHPGVTIKREVYATDDLTNILPLELSSGSGPDVTMINQGYSGMGALVQAGLLLPLNDYADQYNWWDRYALGLHSRNSFSADGQQFGVDNVYGVSNTAEVVGVYYHRDIFEEHGLSIPATLEEFEALMDTLLEAGITPIVFGSLDGWPAIHEFSVLQGVYITLEELDAFMYRLPGGTFNTEANLQAAARLVEWVDKGYFSPGFAGMDYDGATFGGFLNQEGAMWITGNWMTGSIVEELGEEPVGFFAFPSDEAGVPAIVPGGVGLAYGIRATSQQPDLAAEYIDLVTGPRAAELLFERGFFPATAVDPALLTEGTLTADMFDVWAAVSEANAVGHWLDWTAPDVAANIQELMGKVVTPEQFVADVEADYTAR